MATINIGAQRAERAIQAQMMINQFMRQTGIGSNQPTNVERAYSELEEQERWEAEEARRQTESEQRVRISESEHQRKLNEFDQMQDLRERQRNFDEWKGTEDVKRGIEESGRQERELGMRKPLWEAQTGEARARTGLVQEQTRGERDENKRKQNEALTADATRTHNFYISQVQQGKPMSVEDTDRFEQAERMLSGNPHFQVERNPDHTWKVDKELVRMTVMNPDGTPNANFAKDAREVEKPYNAFSQLLSDAKAAEKQGADAVTMKWYKDKIWQQTAPTLGQTEGFIVKQMLDEDNIDGAMDAINMFRKSSAPVVKVPDPRERIDYKGSLKMASQLEDIQTRYQALKDKNKLPVGYLKQPVFDILTKVGKDDPEIQAFRMRVNQFRAKYTLYLSGRATTNEERDDIQKQIPSNFSSFQTFELALPEFRNGLLQDAAIDAGIAKSYGMFVPPGVPVLEPSDVLARDGKLPNVLLDKGAYLSGPAIENHVRGTRAIGNKINQQGVGGPAGNFRNWRAPSRGQESLPGEGQALGAGDMSTETPVGQESDSGTGFDASQFQNPDFAQQLWDKQEEIYREHPDLRPGQ